MGGNDFSVGSAGREGDSFPFSIKEEPPTDPVPETVLLTLSEDDLTGNVSLDAFCADPIPTNCAKSGLKGDRGVGGGES